LASVTPQNTRVNINTANAAELAVLPGIGPTKAAAIVNYRASHGPFSNVDVVDGVPGDRTATVALIRDFVTV
jgi:competence protein ComEA